MKKYKVVSVTNFWSQKKLTIDVENAINKHINLGYELESVQFTYGSYAYITFKK